MPKTGRPPAITPALQKQIAELFFLAFTDEQVALYCGISQKTIQRARRGEFCPAIRKAEIDREIAYRKRIWDGIGNWCGASWFLERKYPHQFAKPEIQLSYTQNFTQNNLALSIDISDAKALEARAAPVRESVKQMFAQYRPAPGNGNGKSAENISKVDDEPSVS